MLKINYEIETGKNSHSLDNYVGFFAHSERETETTLYLITDGGSIICFSEFGALETEDRYNQTIEDFCYENNLILDKVVKQMRDLDITIDIKS